MAKKAKDTKIQETNTEIREGKVSLEKNVNKNVPNVKKNQRQRSKITPKVNQEKNNPENNVPNVPVQAPMVQADSNFSLEYMEPKSVQETFIPTDANAFLKAKAENKRHLANKKNKKNLSQQKQNLENKSQLLSQNQTNEPVDFVEKVEVNNFQSIPTSSNIINKVENRPNVENSENQFVNQGYNQASSNAPQHLQNNPKHQRPNNFQNPQNLNNLSPNAPGQPNQGHNPQNPRPANPGQANSANNSNPNNQNFRNKNNFQNKANNPNQFPNQSNNPRLNAPNPVQNLMPHTNDIPNIGVVAVPVASPQNQQNTQNQNFKTNKFDNQRKENFRPENTDLKANQISNPANIPQNIQSVEGMTENKVENKVDNRNEQNKFVDRNPKNNNDKSSSHTNKNVPNQQVKTNTNRNNEVKAVENKQEVMPAKKSLTFKAELLLHENDKQNPIIKNIMNNVDRFVKNKLFVEKNSKMVLAISGGVDSVVMLNIMYNLAAMYNFELEIAHFNHNLRGDNSLNDEKFVRKLAEKYALPYHTSNGNVTEFARKNNYSIEQAARTLRYKFLERIVHTVRGQFVSTAHNADDSAETFLMNLMRGSGITGLSGIPIKRQFSKNVYVIRPIINLKKREIYEYAKLRNIEWREDESNKDTKFTRNKLRHELIPKLVEEYSPTIVEILNRTARHLAGADKFVNDYVRKNVDNIVAERTVDKISLKAQLFQTYSSFIQGEILNYIISDHFKIHHSSLNVIDRIVDLQNASTGAVVEITGELFAIKDRDRISITRKTEGLIVNQVITRVGTFQFGEYELKLSQVLRRDVDFTKNKNVEYFDMEFMPQFLMIRNWEEGDSFEPIGLEGTQKVSDYLTNEKVSTLDRKDVLVLTDKVDIVWLLGHRISDKYKLSDASRLILRAEWKKVGE